MTDEVRSRTISWSDPAEFAPHWETMSGLQFLRALKDGSIEEPPIAMLIGFRIIEVEEGRVAFEFTPSECHYNFSGNIQGGIPSSVIDAATGSAVYSLLPAGVKYTSLDLKVNYVRPITLESGRLRCEAWTVHMGARTGIAEAKLTDRQGRLHAFGTSLCMIFR